MLTAIILVPLIAALVVAATPRTLRFGVRLVALVATLVTALLAVLLFVRFDSGKAGYQFVTQVPWVESIGISYHVGVDGINVGLVLLAALVAFAAACVSWTIRTHEKEFYLLLLVMTGGILGAFASLDLFFFYFFHELALVPTFIMIGVWGRGPEKNYATFNITLYLSLGALVALIGLIALYLQLPPAARTFDLVMLNSYFEGNPMPVTAQRWIFPVLMFGFGILVSLWPFHSWAPLGYAAAPPATAMLHAGVLKNFGLYGLIRVALPMMPEGARQWLPVLAVLALGNVLYGALVALRQKDFASLIAWSSVAHMGFLFLGLASSNITGLAGAVVLMVAHGLLAALGFALCGYFQHETGSLQMDQLGGLARRLPFIGTITVMAAMAGCGMPGFANFVGEVLVLFGVWERAPLWVVLAAGGALVLGALYMLRAVRLILHGPLHERWESVQDASPWRRVPFVMLVGVLLVFGFFPRLLTGKIRSEGVSGQAAGSAKTLDVAEVNLP